MNRLTPPAGVRALAARRSALLVRGAILLAAFGLGLATGSRQNHAAAQPLRPPQEAAPVIDVARVAAGLSAPASYARAESANQRRAAIQDEAERSGAAAMWMAYVAPGMASEEDIALAATSDPTEAQLEIVREKLDGFMSELGSTLELLPESQRLDMLDDIAEAHDDIAGLSTEQLAEVHIALRPYPGFFSVPAYAKSVLEQVERARAGQAPLLRAAPIARSVDLPGLPGVPDLPRPDDHAPPVPSTGPPEYPKCKELSQGTTCPDGCGPMVEGGEATLFALETAAFAVESVCSYFDGDITLFGTQIPNIAKIICVIGYAAIQVAADTVQLVYDLNEECELDYQRHLVHAYLDATIYSRASQKSHNNHRLYELRIAIENAMLQEADTRLSLFQLPRSQNGYLDAQDDVSVRYVVDDTIRTMSAAGYDVRNAQTEFNTAEAHLAAGRFKDAFARYRLAYRAAVRVGREP